MRQLIFKDFYTQNRVIPFISIFWFVIFTNFFTNGDPMQQVMLLVFLPAWLAIFSNTSTKSFEKESALLISLPIARKEIVLAKYVTSFVWFVIAFVAVFVYVFLFHTFAPFPSRMMTIDEIVIAFSLFTILISLFYPLLFLTEYKVAVIVLVIFTAVAITALRICFHMFENFALAALCFFCISTVILIVSYYLSVYIFNKRDLF